MLRIHTISNAAAAKKYYAFSDYYLESPGDWLGLGAERLGLSGLAAEKDFHALCDNLDPRTGERLTAKQVENRRTGWDFNFNAPKSVSLALELTEDMEVYEAHREAVRYAMGFVEHDMATRVRVGGADEDRITGNLAAMRVTHRTTRPDKSDQMPDPSLHDHVVVFNATFDPMEEKWKAAQIGDIKHDGGFYEAIYHNRLASNLREIGYGLRRKGRSFEIEGVPDKLIEKFSRRTATIEATKREIEQKYGVEMGPEAKAKLGATTRLYKTDQKDFDLNRYWVSRLTGPEKKELQRLHGKKGYEADAEKGVAYAIGHLFERNSVVEPRRVYEEAMRHAIGWVTPESVESEAKRQGLLLKDGLATTRDVLEQEGRIVAFARDGRATCREMGDGAASGYRAQYLGLEDRNVSINTYAASDHPAMKSPGAQAKPFGNEREMGGSGCRVLRPTSPGYEPSKGLLLQPAGDHDATKSLEAQAKKETGTRASESPYNASDMAYPQRDVRGNPRESENGTISFAGPANLVSRPSVSNPVVDQKTSELIDNLSPQQQAAVRHVWTSQDRVILIRGGAGTGKTHMMKAAIDGIDKPVVVLAPSSDASRGVLRKEGFKDADTLASFLTNEKFQQKARNGVIWVDEAGQVSMRQLDQLFKLARDLDARVVLQGDKKQHGAIERGATLRVLEEFAGLPVAELTDIRRQKGDYKQAIGLIQKGDILDGYDKLASMGWVKRTPAFDHNKPLVDDYLAAVEKGKSVLVIAPTHHEGDEITAAIRARLKAKGALGEERVFETLEPLHWTEAEKGDRDRYDGTELVRFVRNSGAFKAGQVVGASRLFADGRPPNPGVFAVYSPGRLSIAPGDAVRITANGKTKDGHRLDNGAVYTIKGFKASERPLSAGRTPITERPQATKRPPTYDIELSNGWVLDGSQSLHLDHAYVSTSYAAQGKTVDRVLVAMGGESRPAMSAEQWYVSLSRGKESATVYTDLTPVALREAIRKTDTRMTATELMQPKAKPKKKLKDKLKEYAKRMKRAYDRLRGEREHEPTTKERENVRER